jgi:hypothetical protein
MLLVAVFSTSGAWAQFSVEDNNKSLQEKVIIGNADMKSIATSTFYQSDARDRLERKNIRKEHNYLELTTQLNAEMWMYNNAWLERRGGDNTIAISGRVFVKHIYTKDKFGITTQLEGNYGYNHIRIELEDDAGNTYKKGNWFKNIDNWWFQTQPSRSIKNNWSYSGLLKLRSQFSKSYSSRKDQTKDNVLTSFMAPGYIDISVGVKYVSPNKKFPIQVTLDPLASSGKIAFNDLVEANYRAKNSQNWFGIEMGKHATFSGGSKVNLAFSRKWGKNDWFEYWTNCSVYYGWITNVASHKKIREWYDYQAAVRAGNQPDNKPPYHVELHPTVEWKNTFTIRTAKYLTTTMQINLFYDKAVSNKAEIQSYLKLGLAYTIKNK